MRAAEMAAFLPLFLLIFASGGRAQTAAGEVNGTVTDKSGGFVAGAAVRLSNLATKIDDRAATNSDRYFVFINVKPGTYILGGDAKGFKTTHVWTLAVCLNQPVTLAERREVGAVSERVVGNAEAG